MVVLCYRATIKSDNNKRMGLISLLNFFNCYFDTFASRMHCLRRCDERENNRQILKPICTSSIACSWMSDKHGDLTNNICIYPPPRTTYKTLCEACNHLEIKCIINYFIVNLLISSSNVWRTQTIDKHTIQTNMWSAFKSQVPMCRHW